MHFTVSTDHRGRRDDWIVSYQLLSAVVLLVGIGLGLTVFVFNRQVICATAYRCCAPSGAFRARTWPTPSA